MLEPGPPPPPPVFGLFPPPSSLAVLVVELFLSLPPVAHGLGKGARFSCPCWGLFPETFPV